MAPLFSIVILLTSLFQTIEALPTDQVILRWQAESRIGNVQDVQAELKKAEIIPTVIDDFLPSLILNVTWPSNETADLGNSIKPKALQDVPSIELFDHAADAGRLSSMQYTVALTDPDAPSRDAPEWSEICHWIATGVSISSFDTSNEQKSEEMRADSLEDVMEYKPPGPPPKTGKHRYVFLVFAPANGTSEKLHLTKPSDRQHWGTGEERHGVRDWAEENGLVPVGANFIYSKNKKQ